MLCALPAAPAEISWDFWRVVMRKSLHASHAITLQGVIKVSGVKGDQTSSGCLFFLKNYYFLFLMPTLCWLCWQQTSYLLASRSPRGFFFLTRICGFSFFLLVPIHPDASLMISCWSCPPSTPELGVNCGLKPFPLFSHPALKWSWGGILCPSAPCAVSSGLPQAGAAL